MSCPERLCRVRLVVSCFILAIAAVHASKDGSCAKECAGVESAPVCTLGGSTLENGCMARCTRQLVAYPGPCTPACTKECGRGKAQLWEPLCHGTERATYASACYARCKAVRAENLMQGTCASQVCRCTREFMPVCGVSGQTYSNPCLAACNEDPVLAHGACPASSKPGATGQSKSTKSKAAQSKSAQRQGGGAHSVARALLREGDATGVVEQAEGGDVVDEGVMNRGRHVAQSVDPIPAGVGEGQDTPGFVGAEGTGEGGAGGVDGVENPDGPFDSSDGNPDNSHGCMCPAVYMPVCGADQKTYGSSCTAACLNVTVVSNSPCPAIPCEDCLDRSDPVCGEDGVTYDNECRATCENVTIAYNQKCDSDDGNGCVCPEIYDPVCGVDGKTYSSACTAACDEVEVADPNGPCAPVPCDLCIELWDPVCGEDGVTYGNGCKASCANATVLYPGECELEASSGNGTSNGEEGCVCPAIWAPVCGDDGVTYGNPCAAACANVTVVSDVPCPTVPCEVCTELWDPVCGEDNKTWPNACKASCANVTVASPGECPGGLCSCPKILRPVCGADGRTYNNECLAVKCAGVPVVANGSCVPSGGCDVCTLEYAPVCGSDGVTYGNPCAANCANVTYVRGECPIVCPGFCAEIWAPVCGTDGKTYGNKCEAGCARTRIASLGECLKPRDTCPDKCEKNLDPVCGADGVTYDNACWASCANATIVSKGECKPHPCAAILCPADGDPVCGVDGVTYPNSCLAFCAGVEVAHNGSCAHVCNKLCINVYEPVCGANGVTYNNRCWADCVGVAIVSNGTCPDTCVCDTIYAPVCGVDGKTYPNSCNAACANATIAYNGSCTATHPCNKLCINKYDPVCGSDGKTYDNSCWAECAQVTVVSAGPCPSTCGNCLQEWDPVCGSDGRTYASPCFAGCAKAEVKSKGECDPLSVTGDCAAAANITDLVCVMAPGAAKGQTFKNGCFAKAAGADLAKGWTYYRGACRTDCDARCNPVDGLDALKFSKSPACCSPAYEYPSACYASCVGGLDATELRKCYPGFCKTGRAVSMLNNVGNCPLGAPAFRCQTFGCVLQRTCPSNPTSKCSYLYPCPKFFRLDFLNEPCAGYYVGTDGKLVKQCQTAGIQRPMPTTCANEGQQCTLSDIPLPPWEAAKIDKVPCCNGVCVSPERPGAIYGVCSGRRGSK